MHVCDFLSRDYISDLARAALTKMVIQLEALGGLTVVQVCRRSSVRGMGNDVDDE